MNVLDIDLANLYEFRREWQLFRDSRVKKFITLWLKKELRAAWCVLENVSEADLGKAQGTVSEIKKTLNLIEQVHCPDEALKEVLAFLEKR